MTRSSPDVPVSRFTEPQTATLHIVVDTIYDNYWGPFESASEAAKFVYLMGGTDPANRDQYEVCALRSPDE